MTDKTLKIFEALSNMQKEISEKGIGKESEAKTQNGVVLYKYRGIDDVYTLLSPLFHKYGVIVGINCLSKETKAVPVKFSIQYQTFISVEYSFTSQYDGSCHKIVMFGEAFDNGDKGLSKALSMAFKYACFQVFCIPLPDADAQVHEPTPAKDFQQYNIHKHQNQNQNQNQDRTITKGEAKHLFDMIKNTNNDPTKILKRYTVSRFGELLLSQYTQTIKSLEQYIQEQQQMNQRTQFN